MSFINKIEKQSENATQLSMGHPLRDDKLEDKENYVNALAAVISMSRNATINQEYIGSICAEFDVNVDFLSLVAGYRKHPERIDTDAITSLLKTSNNFTLLVLDAAMIAPDICVETQTDVLAFVKKLHSLLGVEKIDAEWYPAIFQFATALTKAEKAPDFLVGTTTRFCVCNTWTHIIKFKSLDSGDSAILPELCQCLTPGIVGAMFKSGNYTTTEGGELLLTIALISNNLKVVDFLLGKGIEINATDKDNETALNSVSMFIDTEMLDFLLDRGATVNSETLSVMVTLKSKETIACLMRHRIELPTDTIMTLMLKIENVRTYLENGGDPNLTDGEQSWVDNAIMMGRKELAALLQDFGAVPSPDAKPLSKRFEDLQELLKNFPNISEESIDSQRPDSQA